MAQQEKPSMRIQGADIHVTDRGEGSPTLLFLHFWGGSSGTWAPVIDRLCPTHRCVAIDFRGWGASSKDPGNYSLATLAEDVVAVLAALKLERFVLVGHSMGGKVAQLVAARAPKGLERLILMAPAPPSPLAAPEAQRQGMLASYQDRAGAEGALGILAALPLSVDRRHAAIEDILRGAPDAKRAWTERGMVEDIRGEAAKIAVPLHILVGSADVVENPASLRAAFEALRPGTPFTVIPGAGHLAPLEAPDAVGAAILAALRPST